MGSGEKHGGEGCLEEEEEKINSMKDGGMRCFNWKTIGTFILELLRVEKAVSGAGCGRGVSL